MEFTIITDKVVIKFEMDNDSKARITDEEKVNIFDVILWAESRVKDYGWNPMDVKRDMEIVGMGIARNIVVDYRPLPF